MKFILYTFLLLLLSTLYINYNLFESYRLQYNLITEFNSKTLERSTYEKFKTINRKVPNVIMTALPIAPLYAAYTHAFGDTENALTILDEPVTDNIYIGYREYLKSQIYYDLKVLDSSLFYAKEAYLKIPQNPLHFERLITAYAYKNESDSIIKYFNMYNHDNIDIWKICLTSFLANDSLTRSEALYDIANKAKLKFAKSPEISTYANSILYGLNNVKMASNLAKEATLFYGKSDFVKAAQLFEQASNKNPGEYTHFENAASSYLELKNYKKSIELSNIVLDSFNIELGKSEFIKALSLNSIGEKDQACKLIKLSAKRGFKNAYPFINKFCN